MNLYGHYLDPHYAVCLGCPLELDCAGEDSPHCPRRGLPMGRHGARENCVDVADPVPFPDVLSEAAVQTQSGCRHCLAMADCAASVNAGGPCLCERCGWVTVGSEQRVGEV